MTYNPLDYWDGSNLPPVGSLVLIELGSEAPKKRLCKVTGISIKNTDSPLHHIVFVDVDDRGLSNQRMLSRVWSIFGEFE